MLSGESGQILLDLMQKGASLTGTESPELLMEEYELARQVLGLLDSGRAGTLAKSQKGIGKTLLDKRDRYIAERIDRTLKVGETGLIFLGMLHSLEGLLPSDIRVTSLEKAAGPPGPTRQGGKGR